jgi:hypothetical protein
MPAYFFRSEPGAAELRRLARGQSGRVCQRVLMIDGSLERTVEAADISPAERAIGLVNRLELCTGGAGDDR